MRTLSLLILSSFTFGCAHKVAVTPLPERSAYSGSVVPLSPKAHIDGSISKTDVEHIQKALAREWDGGSAAIDAIFKTKRDGDEVIEVRRLYWFWQFKRDSSGLWLVVAHGTWHS